MSDFKDWLAYKKAFDLAVEVFEISKNFPPEEKYSLTDQVRKSSRSVCANLAEAYRRRRYENYFLSKLGDCETENVETEVWFHFASAFQYITPEQYQKLLSKNTEVGKLLYFMSNNPDKFR